VAIREAKQRPLGFASTWVRIATSFVLLSSGAVVYLLLSLLLLPWRPLRIRIGNVYGKAVGPWVARVLGVRTRVRHRERLAASSPAIYITNHTSALDVFIAMWLCPMGGCGIAKKEIARIPFFGTLKMELLYELPLQTRSAARSAVADYIETFHNVRRRHSSLDYQSPVEFELNNGKPGGFAPGPPVMNDRRNGQESPGPAAY